MLGGALGSPAALDAEVSEVAAYGERDQDDEQMREGHVTRLRLQIVDIPGVSARAPREKHEDAHGQQYVRRASRELHTARSLPERDVGFRQHLTQATCPAETPDFRQVAHPPMRMFIQRHKMQSPVPSTGCFGGPRTGHPERRSIQEGAYGFPRRPYF